MTQISICPECGEGPLTYIITFDGVEWLECGSCGWEGKPGDESFYDTENQRLSEYNDIKVKGGSNQ